ncbi:MAG: hypothetical protein ACR5KV_05715 [Wolbachia sp.]
MERLIEKEIKSYLAKEILNRRLIKEKKLMICMNKQKNKIAFDIT